ncbi:MAG: DeoR/GlpR transcriptional regulator [Erysipelotrichia bacterium]|nr:DeoR/GlpR transcriptional regulator [Erysipelotrichia bacterium]
MLKKERLYRIEALLKQKPFLSISQLQTELSVSRSSVMRDLDELEKSGRIVRERGGAASCHAEDLTRSIYSEPSVSSRENLNAEQKRRIAAAAASYIKDGSCIFLDSGTTPAYIIPWLEDKQVQIVTASTYVSNRIPSSFRGDVYLIGGSYLREYDTVSGSIALEMLDQFNFDCAFIGANGINLKTGEVSAFSEQISALKKHAMKRSTSSILLSDSSKFGVRAMSVFAKLNMFDKVITDSYPENMKKPGNIICADAQKGTKK